MTPETANMDAGAQPHGGEKQSASSLIRTPDQRLRVFISSTLDELANERVAARNAITQLRLTPIFFEQGARPYPPRDLYRAYLAQSDIFIGLYWERYGWVAPAMTISGLEDEHRLAQGKPTLMYVKYPASKREPRLQELINTIRNGDGISYRKFSTPDELQTLIADDLALLLTERFSGPQTSPFIQPALALPAQLPLLTSPLIDRHTEFAQVCSLLRQEDVSLITLTGPGGVGKTRLAIQVAREVREAFSDGVAFVSLETLTDPAEIIPTIARAFGIPEIDGRSPRESLIQFLSRKQFLLVLDNAEQLISSAPLAAQILARAPRLKILVTSREGLRVRGEQIVPLAPLQLPGMERRPGPQELLTIPAVALFVARAQEARPDFVLTEENAEAVVEICRQLDGLPLALELAAARLSLLTPTTLLAHLERPLHVLTHGARDLPTRQRTLRDTLAWSYDLLSEEDKALFRQLAVFAGGFTLEEAQALALAGQTPPAPDEQGDIVLEELAELVDKSLVIPLDTVAGFPRFRMLVTIRQYALEQLEASGERADQQKRHADMFLRLTEQASLRLYLPERDTWIQRLDDEDGNLRAALAWCLPETEEDLVNQGSPSSQEGMHLRRELGLSIAGHLSWYWFLQSRLQEGRFWLERALARTDHTHPTLALGRALNGAANLAVAQGDMLSAEAWAQEGKEIFQTLGDQTWSAYIHVVLGATYIGQGKPAQAHDILEEGLKLYHEAGSPIDTEFTEFDAAVMHYLGRAARVQGDLEQARTNYEQSLVLYRQIGDTLGIGMLLNALGSVAAAQGDDATAQELFAQSVPLVRTTGDRYDVANIQVEVGLTMVRQGDITRGQDLLLQGLRLWRDIGPRTGIAMALSGIAEVAAATGQSERAGRLFGAARLLYSPNRRLQSDHATIDLEQSIARAREQLDSEAFSSGWNTGQSLSEEQAIADALDGPKL